MSKNKGGFGGNSGFGKKPSAGSRSGFGQKPRPGGAKSTGVVYVKDDTPRLSGPRKREAQAQPQINKRLGEFVIERLGHDARGLASLDGKALFIDGALVGETVTARLVAEHPRFIEARVDQVLKAAPERQVPPCKHFVECGGCQLQYMSPEFQLETKQQALLDQMERWAGLRPRQLLAPIRSASKGYRARARLGVWYPEAGGVTFGFRQRASNELTPITHCLVLDPLLDALIAPLQAWLESLAALKSVTHIELIRSLEGATILVRHTRKLRTEDLEALAQLAGAGSAQVYLEGNDKQGLRDLKGELTDPRLTYELGDGSNSAGLAFHPQDFTQVNPAVNKLMVQQALSLLALKPTDNVIDFFCGMGNFTLPIAAQVAQVTGVEGVETMVARGADNARALAINNAQFIKADLASMGHTQVGRICRAADAILLDPPRDGAKALVEQLRDWRKSGQLKARKIVYVSCNPATLARDAKILAEAGFKLDSLGVLDMFPHTNHVESMASFLL